MIRIYRTYNDFNLMLNYVSMELTDGYSSGEPTKPIDWGVITYPVNIIPTLSGTVGGPAPFPVWVRNMYFTPRYTYRNIVISVADVIVVDTTKGYNDTTGEEANWIKFALDSKVNYPRSQNDDVNATGLPTFDDAGSPIEVTNTNNSDSTQLYPDDYFILWVNAEVVTLDPQAGIKFFVLVVGADRAPY